MCLKGRAITIMTVTVTTIMTVENGADTDQDVKDGNNTNFLRMTTKRTTVMMRMMIVKMDGQKSICTQDFHQ